jgi:hypothetical protein
VGSNPTPASILGGKMYRKCKCGESIHESIKGNKCASCIVMIDKLLRKYSEEIANHYQTWGSPTFFTYHILERLKKEIESKDL